MARIVGGSMLGELSGKLGGMVFSRNKSGAYIRQYVIPINPDSGAQLEARSSFAGAVGSFHSLTGALKSSWQNFAQGAFNPKNAINTGQFSGINAYTALLQAITHGNKLIDSPEISVNGTPLVVQPSYGDLTFNNIPPNYTVQPNLQVIGSGGVATYGTLTGQVDRTGKYEIVMNINPGVTGAPNLAGFVDGVNHPIGYAVYMSESHVQEGLFYANPTKYLLGVIPQSEALPADLLAVTSIGFKSAGVVNRANYQAFPEAGNFVRLSVYAIASDSGTMMCVGVLDDGSHLGELEVGLAIV